MPNAQLTPNSLHTVLVTAFASFMLELNYYAPVPGKGSGRKQGRSEARNLDCCLIENLTWSVE